MTADDANIAIHANVNFFLSLIICILFELISIKVRGIRVTALYRTLTPTLQTGENLGSRDHEKPACLMYGKKYNLFVILVIKPDFGIPTLSLSAHAGLFEITDVCLPEYHKLTHAPQCGDVYQADQAQQNVYIGDMPTLSLFAGCVCASILTHEAICASTFLIINSHIFLRHS